MIENFKKQQFELTSAITNPSQKHTFEARRLKVYQELIFNNIEGFCATAFPVFKSVVDENLWLSLVRDFLVNGDKSSPHFVDIAEQFLTFMAQPDKKKKYSKLPDYSIELLHYEWVELNVSLQDFAGQEGSNTDAEVDISQVQFTLPASTWPLAYQFPVHTICAANAMKIEQEPTFLVVYLDIDGDVQFLKTNALVIQTLHYIENHSEQQRVNRRNIAEYLVSVGLLEDLASAENFLNQALQDLLSRSIILHQK